MQKSILFKNTNISFSDIGKGTAVVLLHGFLENKTMWKNITPVLAKKNRVIAIDLLGHGKTDCLGYVHSLTLFSEAIEAVLKHLKLRRFYIIGHSLGGYVALKLADRNPIKIKGLCLLNSTSNEDDDARKALRIRANNMAQQNFENLIRMSFVNLFTASSRDKFSKEIEFALHEALKTTKQGYIAANEGMRIRLNRNHVLAENKFKKLIIAGKNDPVLQFETAKKEAKKTNSELIGLDGGHMSHIENKEALSTILLNFLS
ncbi:alpha/beta hydrolase [Polaribacter sp.]|uniref:alpha/beta fold hydrolase n=1 Tax=Polaribacter sp. TaxID=1920175 RepID=UPI0025FA3CC0|nr:alpha/beta hydrolase [Polaribacter sp.]